MLARKKGYGTKLLLHEEVCYFGCFRFLTIFICCRWHLSFNTCSYCNIAAFYLLCVLVYIIQSVTNKIRIIKRDNTMEPRSYLLVFYLGHITDGLQKLRNWALLLVNWFVQVWRIIFCWAYFISDLITGHDNYQLYDLSYIMSWLTSLMRLQKASTTWSLQDWKESSYQSTCPHLQDSKWQGFCYEFWRKTWKPP